ncbi:MAG TPA: anti-sigma factor [Gemmatimonadota bacterium]
MSDERFRELIEKLLLWDLEPEEEAELEAELAVRGGGGDADIARLREAIAAVALTAPAAAPPAGLRDRLLARIGAAGMPMRAEDLSGTEDGGGTAIGGAAPAGADRRPWIAAALLAALLALLLGLWTVKLRDDLGDARRELAETRARLERADGVERRADSLASAADAYRRDVDALTSRGGSARNLAGTPEEPAASARVFVDPRTRRAILFAFDLPVLPADAVYELWAIRDGTPQGVGTFAPRTRGVERVELENPDALEGADALAVTVEPAPGTNAPTGRMVLISS